VEKALPKFFPGPPTPRRRMILFVDKHQRGGYFSSFCAKG
jgi:hypothetical protein